jgi:hypothetical protein
MNLTLSADAQRLLRELLRDDLPDLKFEVARTDASELRHVLVERQTLCERLIAQLDDTQP